ncbi:hypothetical protein KY290_026159 [Solanum tuberosum]|uniref:Tf2-1-like SH3-like domain-containing protein n=1 Tax=Solanum tuberosum TaxID=4113 RepID=A0ABQ7UXA5_SOLTU|nr:hypothetical protein KY289_025258 [Solanum tuberosum]KAH0674719.1 hypothetical protein KY284_025806 [Solanum tuberosum]KAH0755889.1 hypothetical protein KY290_026159 [Solanum tuberosum]
MDFVVGLPKTLGKFDSIWVVVDRLSKSAHFIPVRIDYNAEQLAKMYVKEIVRLHGVPSLSSQTVAGDVKPLGVDLVKDAQDKVRSIQARLLAAQSRKKKYADHKVRDMAFQIGENVLLKVSPMKRVMRFGKKGKLSPRYIGPFEVLECVGPVAYKLALPPNLSDKDLQYEEEPITILDRDVCKLRTKEIKSVKVQWKHRPVEEATWELRGTCETSIPNCLLINVLLHSFFSLFFISLSLGDE